MMHPAPRRFTMNRVACAAAGVALLTCAALSGQETPRTLGVRAVAFSPDGKLLAAGYADNPPGRGRITVWDVGSRQVRWTQERPERIWGLSFSPDGKTLAVGASGPEAKLLNADNGQPQAALPGHGKSTPRVAFAPDGKTVAVGSYDGFIKIWDVAKRAEVKSLEGHSGHVSMIAYSPDGRLLVSAAGEDVKLWDVATGQTKHTWTHGGSFCPCAIFPGDSRWLLTGVYDGTIRLRSTETGEQRCKFQNVGGVDRLAFHPASRMLAICTNSRNVELRALDFREPSETDLKRMQALLEKLDHDDYDVREAAGKEFLAIGFLAEPELRRAAKESASAEVRIRARRLRQELLTRPLATLSHTSSIEAIAFSPDGKLLASGGKDGTVRLWDVAARKELACLEVSGK